MMEQKPEVMANDLGEDELFEEIEEIVTAGWLGCASCCN